MTTKTLHQGRANIQTYAEESSSVHIALVRISRHPAALSFTPGIANEKQLDRRNFHPLTGQSCPLRLGRLHFTQFLSRLRGPLWRPSLTSTPDVPTVPFSQAARKHTC